MPNLAKKAIIQARVQGVLTDLMPFTNAESVMVNETTTLPDKLAEILSAVAELPTRDTVTAAIAAL